jgi:hypothetical protein
VFSILISTDDHLRNHGFLDGARGSAYLRCMTSICAGRYRNGSWRLRQEDDATSLELAFSVARI